MPPRVLIVDDKPNMVSLCSEILAEHYEVDGAANGEEALRKLCGGGFDVVVTDVRMPLLDGHRLLDEIRQRGLNVEVVLMTAYGSIAGAVGALRAGALDYLSKPFDPEALEAAVARALARRRAPPPATAPIDPISFSYREAITQARERTSQQYILALLRFCEGNVTRAADLAGLERESLHRLMRRYGIRAEDFRARPREEQEE